MSKNALRKLIRKRNLPEDEERIREQLFNSSVHTVVLLSVSQLQRAPSCDRRLPCSQPILRDDRSRCIELLS
jgi:hypothetical protein